MHLGERSVLTSKNRKGSVRVVPGKVLRITPSAGLLASLPPVAVALPRQTVQRAAEAFFDLTVGLENEAKKKGKALGCLVTPQFEYIVQVSARDGKPVVTPEEG